MLANGHSPEISGDLLDARYFKALDRFDIRFARTMWVYDNVRPKSDLLHLGCGSGLLALLKRKEILLTGVDVSNEAALVARRNGYDSAVPADLGRLPFNDAAFDYVVGFDVLDNSDDARRDSVLAEMKRVLRPGGVTLQAIRCDEQTSDTQHVNHFLKCFPHVAYEPRHAVCGSAEDFLAENKDQHHALDADLVEYLRELSFKERRAFDLAMGYAYSKLSDLNVALPGTGFNILLKASNAPLGAFYNEHRDRRALFGSGWKGEVGKDLCLDRHDEAEFDDGWHEATMLPPVARWMGKRARVKFPAPPVAQINLDLKAQLPDLATKPLGIEVSLNEVRLCAVSVYQSGWLELAMTVPDKINAQAAGEFELELRASRTVPAEQAGLGLGDREVSIAVCNIVVHP
jgi:ubiquinone/menaquinone biosynthesis C-methylase UbiE